MKSLIACFLLISSSLLAQSRGNINADQIRADNKKYGTGTKLQTSDGTGAPVAFTTGVASPDVDTTNWGAL